MLSKLFPKDHPDRKDAERWLKVRIGHFAGILKYDRQSPAEYRRRLDQKAQPGGAEAVVKFARLCGQQRPDSDYKPAQPWASLLLDGSMNVSAAYAIFKAVQSWQSNHLAAFGSALLLFETDASPNQVRAGYAKLTDEEKAAFDAALTQALIDDFESWKEGLE